MVIAKANISSLLRAENPFFFSVWNAPGKNRGVDLSCLACATPLLTLKPCLRGKQAFITRVAYPATLLLAFTVSLCKELEVEDTRHSLSPNTRDRVACPVFRTLSSQLGHHRMSHHVTHFYFKRSFKSLPNYHQTGLSGGSTHL